MPIFYEKHYIGAFELGVSPKKLLDYIAKFNKLEGFLGLEKSKSKELVFTTHRLDEYKDFLPKEGEKSIMQKLIVSENRYVVIYSFTILGLEKQKIGEFVFLQDLSKYYHEYNSMVEKSIILFVCMGSLLLMLLLYVFALWEKTALQLKNRADLMLNAQGNIVIITEAGLKIKEVNVLFLDFFGVKTLEEFKKVSNCICDYFIKEEGYLAKEVDGLNWVYYVLSKPKEKHLAKIADRNGKPHSFRVAIRALHGDSILKEYVVTFEDITDELEAQQALEFERDLFADGPVVTIEWSPEQNWPIRYVSANFTKALGYTPEEMQADSFVYAKLIHPDDQEQVFEEVQTYIQNRVVYYEQSYRLRLSSGEYKWFYDFSHLVFDNRGELLSIRGYMFDQSEIKKAEEMLAEQKERLQNIIDGTNVGTWEWNVQTGETLFNEKWAELIGYRLEDLEPTTIETWMHFANAEDLKAAEESLQETLSGKREFYDAKCRMKHKNGEEIWIYDRGKVVKRDQDGRPLIMSGTHTNIDAEVKAKEQLEELNKTLQSALLAKSQFLANMSHEIRTPMNAILGLSELLKDTELDSKQFDFLEKIHSSSQMLLRIINDILDFSKLEAGKLDLEKKPFRFEHIFEQMRVLFFEQAQKKSLKLHCEVESGVPAVVSGDILRLEQVVSNLISNALKFTHKGSISLQIALKERVDATNAVVRVSVKDSGIGISKEEQERLFLPFSQADSSTTRKFGGTGLGLVISSKIIKAMGSKIELDSEVGRGSEFFFDLPCHVVSWSENESFIEEHTQEILPHSNQEKFDGNRVLLVEDNELNIEVAKLMLERLGIDVIVSKNGKEALRDYFAKREDIDLILMDLQMPEMDGYEATQAIRKEDTYIPIIALSAAALAEDKERALHAGMNGHLSKPIESQNLLNILLEYLPKDERKSQTQLSKDFFESVVKKLQESTVLSKSEEKTLLDGIKEVCSDEEYNALRDALGDLELERAAVILTKNRDLIL